MTYVNKVLEQLALSFINKKPNLKEKKTIFYMCEKQNLVVLLWCNRSTSIEL